MPNPNIWFLKKDPADGSVIIEVVDRRYMEVRYGVKEGGYGTRGLRPMTNYKDFYSKGEDLLALEILHNNNPIRCRLAGGHEDFNAMLGITYELPPFINEFMRAIHKLYLTRGLH